MSVCLTPGMERQRLCGLIYELWLGLWPNLCCASVVECTTGLAVSLVCSEERYTQYDNMSAYELFRRCGVSQRVYDEFLRPTLLVGLFAPPEQLSAASVLETLYFYALAHQNDFDGEAFKYIIIPAHAYVLNFKNP